jgi:hypothetical protein
MAYYYKVLGQAAPSTTANTDVYTVASGRMAVISSIVICNTTATAATYNVYQRIAGATASTANAIVYGATVPANTTNTIEVKITLGATDVITVASGTGSALTYTVNGSEIY